MTRTFIIKSAAYGLGGGNTFNYNPVTGEHFQTAAELTDSQISSFKSEVPAYKQKFYAIIKPMLAKGGFIFDPTLWKWEIKLNGRRWVTLWVTITFVDESDATKTEFMQWIRQTGIMNYDFEIVKQYG